MAQLVSKKSVTIVPSAAAAVVPPLPKRMPSALLTVEILPDGDTEQSHPVSNTWLNERERESERKRETLCPSYVSYAPMWFLERIKHL